MMSAMDPPLQEMVYRSLKEDYAAGVFSPGRRLDVQEIADRHRSSKTPAREALCRLMGEGLIEPHPDGGLRLSHYNGEKLIQLYAWNMSLLMGLVHDVRLPALKRAIEEATPQTLPQTPVGVTQAVGSLFLSLASATGNEFAISSVNNLNERLHYIRIGEIQDLGDAVKEVRTLTNVSVADLQKSMRRRLEAYHMRRIDRQKFSLV
ncbi:GntR family transcriptional regulator [Novosphingobium aquimarinum]|uniref:GntR family transcriptional regulator n=1 Tax=Novosphingobium aquimarinum TaxID=2682494 RepID=UPI0018DC5599|nr:GntR family transcriptional regulator [Novosphingobium aquimarinum]